MAQLGLVGAGARRVDALHRPHVVGGEVLHRAAAGEEGQRTDLALREPRLGVGASHEEQPHVRLVVEVRPELHVGAAVLGRDARHEVGAGEVADVVVRQLQRVRPGLREVREVYGQGAPRLPPRAEGDELAHHGAGGARERRAPRRGRAIPGACARR